MSDDFEVTDAADAGRFELRRSGDVVGFATYRRRGNAVVVPHVETVAPHRGRGFASRLMAGVVEIVRRDGHTIVPDCSFAADYFLNHPEHADIVHGARGTDGPRGAHEDGSGADVPERTWNPS